MDAWSLSVAKEEVLEQLQKCIVTSFLQNPTSWLTDKGKKLLLINECELFRAHLEPISTISLFPTQASPAPQFHRGSLGLWNHKGTLS